MTKPLDNPKWEKFAQAVAFGLSAAEAYRQHVARQNTSEAAIETNGPDLARNAQVSLRIVDLKGRVCQQVEKKFDLTKDKWLDRMMGIANKAEEVEDFAAAKGALAEVGKACDYYAPIKVEHEHSGTIEHTHSFDGVIKSIIDSGSPVTRRLEKTREREVELIPLEPAKKKK